MERAWYIVGMLLNVNYLSDSLSCVTKCSLSDSPVHISLFAFLHVVLLKGCSLPLFLIPHPQFSLSTCTHGSRRSVCFSSPGGATYTYRRRCEPDGLPYPITLVWLRERGDLPSGASGLSPMTGSPLAVVETSLWHIFVQVWLLLKG